MDRNIIEALLDRYLKGETSAEENRIVEDWLEKSNNSHSEWQLLNPSRKNQWLEEVLGEIQNSIQASKSERVVIPQRHHLWRHIAAVAAVLAICFTLYLEWPAFQGLVQSPALTALTVPLNQQKQIKLADGSKVWINSNSQLKYPPQFNGKTREVYLSGEAYFDIKHDADKPFIIHTGKVVTTVLGTAFDIKEDKMGHTIVVTVTRGKVSVVHGDRQLGIITPNQQISYNLLDSKSVQTEVDAKQAIAWQKTELHFEDITFAEAALELEQRFNVKINFSHDKIKDCRFTGTAIKGEKLDQILKVICAFNHATYQKKSDGSIMIDGAGCN